MAGMDELKEDRGGQKIEEMGETHSHEQAGSTVGGQDAAQMVTVSSQQEDASAEQPLASAAAKATGAGDAPAAPPLSKNQQKRLVRQAAYHSNMAAALIGRKTGLQVCSAPATRGH